MGGGGGYGGGRRSILNYDDLADTALVVNFLYFAVADCVLVGSLALARDEWGGGHHCGI